MLNTTASQTRKGEKRDFHPSEKYCVYNINDEHKANFVSLSLSLSLSHSLSHSRSFYSGVKPPPRKNEAAVMPLFITPPSIGKLSLSNPLSAQDNAAGLWPSLLLPYVNASQYSTYGYILSNWAVRIFLFQSFVCRVCVTRARSLEFFFSFLLYSIPPSLMLRRWILD